MNRKEEYAIAVIILVALVMTVASMITSDMNLGVGAVVIGIVAVLYSIYVIHAEARDQEVKQQYVTKQAKPQVEAQADAGRKYNRHSAMKDSDRKAAINNYYTGASSKPAVSEGDFEEDEPVQIKKTMPKQQNYDVDEDQEESQRKGSKSSRNMLGTEEE